MIHRQLIAMCSILGVISTRLENSSLQAPHHNQQRLHIVLRLLVQGSVVVAVMSLGGWGMVTLGSHTLSSQSDSLKAERDPIYVAGCQVPDPLLEKDSARGGVGEDRGCTEEGFSHPITSRRSGGGLDRHAHGAQRQSEGNAPPQTSENSPSTRLGE